MEMDETKEKKGVELPTILGFRYLVFVYGFPQFDID
jgi:hypothetical protein